MLDEIAKIEASLSKIRKQHNEANTAASSDEIIAEIPELVKEIVNYLQPLLTPYEAAYYWHLFTKTILETKRQEGVFSIRGLCTGVVWPSRATQATAVPQKVVSEILASLESKGVIVRIGETTRTGTAYKVCLPEQIEICRENMKRVIDNNPTPDVTEKIDFYNIKENRLSLYERDNYTCYKCGKLLTRWDATLDHILPVSRGGKNTQDNLITCCLMCNSRRRNKEVELNEN
jgi:5-methylcytosine-specific restriction endonuclease McrA